LAVDVTTDGKLTVFIDGIITVGIDGEGNISHLVGASYSKDTGEPEDEGKSVTLKINPGSKKL